MFPESPAAEVDVSCYLYRYIFTHQGEYNRLSQGRQEP